MRDGHRLRRAVAVFGENEIRLSPTWIVALERIGPVQQNHDVSILFETIMQINPISDEIVCASTVPS